MTANTTKWTLSGYQVLVNGTPFFANSNGFDNLFSTFANATQSNPRPLMLTEWGAPASTHNSQGDITDMSAEQMKNLCAYVSGHYQNMLDNSFSGGSASAVCCGGTHFEWTDEWWKADPIPCNAPTTCYAGVWNAGPTMNSVGNFPGNYWDEEDFGLNAIAPACRKPRCGERHPLRQRQRGRLAAASRASRFRGGGLDAQ